MKIKGQGKGDVVSGHEYHILNLGAGVQSTALYLMFMCGELTPQIDCAIFADTQEEPAAVYKHLDWLVSLGGPAIVRRTKGSLGDDLSRGDSTGQRFASIPAFTKAAGGDMREGRTRRHCSKEYKVDVIEQAIRRDVLGLEPRKRIPRGTKIHQYLGISLDEAGRAKRLLERKRGSWATYHFPLIDKFMTRGDCLAWLGRYGDVPHVVPRSACTFCPYRSDAEWERLRDEDPVGWARAIYIDEKMREPGIIVNRGLKQALYLHRSCQPLALVQLDPKPPKRQMNISFWAECEGVCGV